MPESCQTSCCQQQLSNGCQAGDHPGLLTQRRRRWLHDRCAAAQLRERLLPWLPPRRRPCRSCQPLQPLYRQNCWQNVAAVPKKQQQQLPLWHGVAVPVPSRQLSAPSQPQNADELDPRGSQARQPCPRSSLRSCHSVPWWCPALCHNHSPRSCSPCHSLHRHLVRSNHSCPNLAFPCLYRRPFPHLQARSTLPQTALPSQLVEEQT
mmetsp:Transcript_81507/g.170468  ORF Transcript_81507/g.170468 Transcript_81507/m.170468 type:complete len:207 (+) Transcript_81507:347-967(+)